MLVGRKHGGTTKWKVPIIMGFICCDAIARDCCKNASTVSHSGNVANA